MKKVWLPLAGFIIGILLMASTAEAQKTCARVSATSQNCTATLDWPASITDATHDAPTSYIIRRADGAGAKTQIGTTTAAVITFQNVFTDAGNINHCWDVLGAIGTVQSATSSPSACWQTPAIAPLPSNPPTSLIVR